MPVRKQREFARENPDNTEAHVEVGNPVNPNDLRAVQEKGYAGQAVSDEDKYKYTVAGVCDSANSTLTGGGVESDGGLDVTPADTSGEPAAGEAARGRRGRHDSQEG